MSNPWDIQGPSPHGDQDEEKVYAAVGRALSCWEELEEALADLFTCFMGSQVPVHDSSHPACQVYGSIPSFNSRSDMLDVPASAYFEKYNHPEIYDYYKDTIMRCP
jgi:hypothetical protein